MDPPRSTSKNIRLLIKVLPWAPSTAELPTAEPRREKILPFLVPCSGDCSIQELAEIIEQKFARIHTGKGLWLPSATGVLDHG